MIAFARSKRLLMLCMVFVTGKAWELPSFMMENLQSIDQSVHTDRGLVIAPLAVTNTTHSSLTQAPTESPAPSPSPSETPTLTPSVTGNPSRKPSESPTESPAPSPSPSETPTIAPSLTPSTPPTNYPTISNMPSGLPSVSPSAVPSARPSVSPSASPTISMQPSSAPSLERVVSAKFFVQLPIETGPLNTTQIQDLQNATSSYVEDDVPVSRGRVMQVFVKITDQSVVHVSNTTTATTAAVANTTTRRLAIWSELNLAQALQLNLTISGLYFGSDKNFDLHKALAAKFQQAPNSLWFARLAAADGVFASLAPAPAPTGANPNGVAATSSAPDSSNNGLSKSTVAVVSLLAVAALALGVGASVYSIRHYKRRSMYGQELSSPRLSITASSLGSRIANENLEYHTKQLALESTTPTLFARPKIEEEKEEVQEEEVKVEEIRAVNSTESSWNGQMLPLSPNSLEKGGIVPLDQIMQNKPRLKEPPKPNWSHVPFSISNNNRAKDPPSADSEINFPSQRRTDQQQHTDSRHISSLADNNTEMSDMTRSYVHNGASHEIMLTRSQGGTLGAAPVASSNAGSGFTASDFSSHAVSFFSGLVNGQGARAPDQPAAKPSIGKPNGIGGQTLGARAVEPKESAQLRGQEAPSSYESMPSRAGLYNVFAPPGPIGIVVDTTKNGPAVHSLKRTSPMLGLINPGDLIVGLDDEDVRGMTAATLTRLMARKSNQKERKITLLTTDNL